MSPRIPLAIMLFTTIVSCIVVRSVGTAPTPTAHRAMATPVVAPAAR